MFSSFFPLSLWLSSPGDPFWCSHFNSSRNANSFSICRQNVLVSLYANEIHDDPRTSTSCSQSQGHYFPECRDKRDLRQERRLNPLRKHHLAHLQPHQARILFSSQTQTHGRHGWKPTTVHTRACGSGWPRRTPRLPPSPTMRPSTSLSAMVG